MTGSLKPLPYWAGRQPGKDKPEDLPANNIRSFRVKGKIYRVFEPYMLSPPEVDKIKVVICIISENIPF